VRKAKGLSSWKPVSEYVLKVSVYPTCRGLSPWRANELSILELGRTEAFRTEAAEEAEEVTKQYGVSVVGLTHSRGVAGVMPSGTRSPLEGVSGLTQRGKF